MTFNGVDLSDSIIVEKVDNAPIPPIKITTQSAPGRSGARFVSKSLGTREIKVEVTVCGNTRAEYMQKVRSIVKTLHTPDIGKLSGLPGDDCWYNATLSGWTMEKLMSNGHGSIEFFCADPYAYRIARALPLNEVVAVQGTVGAQGIITQTVHTALTGDISFTLDGTTKAITVFGPFAMDDRLVIDTGEGYATLNGVSCMNRLDVFSDWFELPADKCKVNTFPGTLVGGSYTYLERWL